MVNKCHTHFWLDNVLYYELETVVRQTNKDFISVLNRARIGQQNDADLSYLNMTCCKTAPNNPKFPYLFHRNSTISEHNRQMLDLLPGIICMLEAIDEAESHANNFNTQTQKSSLPTVLYLKIGILVELIGANLDTQDGLVNGANGVFQLHTTMLTLIQNN